MKLNIFWRMIISYLTIVVFVIIIGSYSIVKWNQVNKITDSILTIDQPLIDTENKMIDSLLSQVRNEQKYLITRDVAFYNLFQSHKSEFKDYLNQLILSLKTPEVLELIDDIEDMYSRYELLLDQEITAMKTNISFSETQQEEEKKELVDRLSGGIEKLILLGESNINRKIEYSRQTGSQAALIVQGLAFVSLILGLILAFFITRSINRPIKILEASTKQIGEGKFDSIIAVHSPPELAVLANSFSQMSDRLREIDEMKSGFIAHISHELRTPLTSMNEANNLLLDKVAGGITKKQEHLLEIIKQGNTKLIKLINELLDLAKMEAGMMDYQFTKADIGQVIDQCIDDISLLTKKKEIQIQRSIEKDMPSISMDVDKIKQVMNNLLSNAIKFTPEKGIVKVETETYQKNHTKPKRDNNSFVQVRVANTGVSIPQQYLHKIFDKFQQIETEIVGPVKGTGLGLSIARHIVEAHDGKIWAEERIEKGSVFSFILPLNEKQRPLETG